MFEKSEKKLAALVAPLGLAMGMALASAGAVAHSDGPYLSSGGGDIVTNGAGECWNAVGGEMSGLPECGAAAAAVDGDADGDGVADSRDECPNTPAGVAVTPFGCPRDSDGDGVADYMDKCPGTARGVTVDAKGCAIAGAAVVNTVADNFDFDSAELKPAQKAALDNAANTILNTPANEQVEVIGHTDSTGPEAYNQMLSERRAQAAADYLGTKGVFNTTITGMGESQPAADNGTRAGRAANRRVEVRTK